MGLAGRLHLDDLEDEDRAAISEAKELLAHAGSAVVATDAPSDAPPAEPTKPRIHLRCPQCGEGSVSNLQVSFPAWFRVVVDHSEDGVPILSPGDHIDTDAEAQPTLYCESCGESGDQHEFIGYDEQSSS